MANDQYNMIELIQEQESWNDFSQIYGVAGVNATGYNLNLSNEAYSYFDRRSSKCVSDLKTEILHLDQSYAIGLYVCAHVQDGFMPIYNNSNFQYY